MRTYFILATVALLSGIVGGVGLGSWSATKNHFTPSNLESPLGDSSSNPSVSSGDIKPRPQAVVVNGERFEFGSMRRSAHMNHTFYIRNTGSAPLSIQLGKTTCKCTISKLEKDEVPPNESVGVTLEWTAKGESANFKQSAMIATNDPEREFIQLIIEGMVEDTIRIDPPSLHFANLPSSETATQEFRILGSKSLESLGIESYELIQRRTAEYYDVKIRDLTAEEIAEEKNASRGILVSVTIKPGLPRGDIDQTIAITTTVPEAPPFNVKIGGNIIGDISVIGRGYDVQRGILVLNGVAQSEGAETQLLILVKGENREKVQLRIAEVDPADGLEAVLSEPKVNERNVTYTLTVRVPQNAPRMTRQGNDQGKLGRILIVTENSVIKELPIQVKFSIY